MSTVIAPEIWNEIIQYLTPKSIGRLECTCKEMKNTVKKTGVWEHQAVLSWNGFYVKFEKHDDHGERVYLDDVIQFINLPCQEYRASVGRFVAAFKADKEWRTWDGILCEMEMVGEGYKTEGYLTEDPKLIIQNELVLYRDDIDEFGGRDWVSELRDSFWSEDAFDSLNGDEENDSYSDLD